MNRSLIQKDFHLNEVATGIELCGQLLAKLRDELYVFCALSLKNYTRNLLGRYFRCWGNVDFLEKSVPSVD